MKEEEDEVVENEHDEQFAENQDLEDQVAAKPDGILALELRGQAAATIGSRPSECQAREA